MPWGSLAAQVGLQALGSFLGNGGSVQKYNLQAQQAQRESQAYLAGIKEVRQLSKALSIRDEKNTRVLKADVMNFANSQYMAGLAKMQDSLSRRVAASNMHLTSRAEGSDLASHAVANAAVGNIGSSARAAAQTISRNHDAVRSQVEMQRIMERDAAYQEERSIYASYAQSQQVIDTTLPDVPDSPRVYRTPSSGGGLGDSFFGHLLGAGISVGANYFGSKFKLGLKDKG